MKHDPHHNREYDLHRPLVTVERQYETDIATGKTQGRMFVKMYFEARDSGLLAMLPGELWKMLCCLATYMDENGNCSPSQERIARDLGLSRQRVNERQDIGIQRGHVERLRPVAVAGHDPRRPGVVVDRVRDDGGEVRCVRLVLDQIGDSKGRGDEQHERDGDELPSEAARLGSAGLYVRFRPHAGFPRPASGGHRVYYYTGVCITLLPWCTLAATGPRTG